MKKRVLIVEDELPSRMLLEHLLSLNYEVTSLANGLEAIEWLNSGNVVDLIITDLDMPMMSGTELLYQLESTPLHHSIPVVVLSSSNQEDLENLKKSGRVNAVMSKPYNPKTLQNYITLSLEKRNVA